MDKITTEAQFTMALIRVGQLMSAKPGTPEGYELETLSQLVEAYDKETDTRASDSKIDIAIEWVVDEMLKCGKQHNAHNDWDLAAKIAEEVFGEPADKWRIMAIVSIAGAIVSCRVAERFEQLVA